KVDPDLLATVLDAVCEITGHDDAAAEDDLTGFGIGSMDATRLVNRLRQRTGRGLTIADVFTAASFADLAALLQKRCHVDADEETAAGGPGALTHAQERMWFLHQTDPESAAYHVFGALALDGPLDRERLGRAFRSVVARHDILTSRHGVEDGLPVVWREPGTLPELTFRDAEDGAVSADLLRSFAAAPFRIDAEPPIRAMLIRLREEAHVFAVCVHHIAADGWSMRLLARETASLYADPNAVLPPAPSYLEEAPRLRARVERGGFAPQLEYWKRRLAGHPGIIPLPTDFPRPPVVRSEGGLAESELSPDLRLAVADFARRHRVTPFMVYLAAYLLLLRGHGAGDDLVVAIPVANRNRHETEPLVGTLVNTLPFRLKMDGGKTLSAMLQDLRSAALDMQQNQDIPFEAIVNAMQPDRSSDHPPLAQVMFDHQEIPIHDSWDGGLRCRHHPSHRGAAQFDLSLFLVSFTDRETLSIEYRRDLFRHETAERLLERMVRLLEHICGNPDETCGRIPVNTVIESSWLEQVGRGPVRPEFPGQTAVARILERVARHPDRTAIVAGGECRTYQEMRDRPRSVAAGLRLRGVGPGGRVAVMLERDADLPPTLLGIWLAGAAYVPLDRANPPERLRRVLTDQGEIPVLAAPSLADLLPEGQQIIPHDDEFKRTPHDGVEHVADPAGSAYVIYTSGSTGLPKGVVVRHGALANFLLSMAESPGFTEADRMLAVTTVSFDISTLELFLPLVCG
ncbi:MAG: AMP-binding protein, partial [Verrucomicrobiae bacterium]|nr:AMP-binding protein [Verrucomicrobiae bacterium]